VKNIILHYLVTTDKDKNTQIKIVGHKLSCFQSQSQNNKQKKTHVKKKTKKTNIKLKTIGKEKKTKK